MRSGMSSPHTGHGPPGHGGIARPHAFQQQFIDSPGRGRTNGPPRQVHTSFIGARSVPGGTAVKKPVPFAPSKLGFGCTPPSRGDASQPSLKQIGKRVSTSPARQIGPGAPDVVKRPSQNRTMTAVGRVSQPVRVTSRLSVIGIGRAGRAFRSGPDLPLKPVTHKFLNLSHDPAPPFTPPRTSPYCVAGGGSAGRSGGLRRGRIARAAGRTNAGLAVGVRVRRERRSPLPASPAKLSPAG